MRNDLNYSASDCFETFPFPEAAAFAALDLIGEQLDTERAAYMKQEGIGLTTTYNRLKDSTRPGEPLEKLRDLHEELDSQVLAAYGWSDIVVPPYCGATPQQLEAFEDEVLDRLFALNAERAKAEALEASSPRKPKARPKKQKA